MHKLLTIAISAYNKENYLERCISSLISKNIQLLEIIIVNDGSTDRTSDIAHSFEKSYPESIIVIDKANGHQGSCINRAIKLATGRYFKMLDADDYFSTDVLDNIILLLKNRDVDMIVTGHLIHSKEPVSILPKNIKENIIYNHEDIDFSKLEMENCLGMHGVAFRTKILKEEQIQLTEKCSFSDAEYCYYPLKYCKTIIFINQNLYIYQTGVEGQESSLKSEKVKNDSYRISRRMIDDYFDNPTLSPTIKRNEEIIIYRCLIAYLSLYLLHFKTNKKDNFKTDELLSICKKKTPYLYNQLLKTHTRKIPFVYIYKKTKNTSHYLFKILNFIHNLIK